MVYRRPSDEHKCPFDVMSVYSVTLKHLPPRLYVWPVCTGLSLLILYKNFILSFSLISYKMSLVYHWHFLLGGSIKVSLPSSSPPVHGDMIVFHVSQLDLNMSQRTRSMGVFPTVCLKKISWMAVAEIWLRAGRSSSSLPALTLPPAPHTLLPRYWKN